MKKVALPGLCDRELLIDSVRFLWFLYLPCQVFLRVRTVSLTESTDLSLTGVLVGLLDDGQPPLAADSL